jgi:hypothetical protein
MEATGRVVGADSAEKTIRIMEGMKCIRLGYKLKGQPIQARLGPQVGPTTLYR